MVTRQLHDTTGQDLVSLHLNLKLLDESGASMDEGARQILIENLALVEQSIQEVRTLSYLLHPPLLDDAGLVAALRWYVSGFAARSGIRVELDAAGDPGRLPREVETALFRVVQECLTNIHRHSGSPTAAILSETAELEIRDVLPKSGPPPPRGIATLAEMEHAHILAALDKTGWKVSGEGGAARMLGLKPTALEARMRKLGIQRKHSSASSTIR